MRGAGLGLGAVVAVMLSAAPGVHSLGAATPDVHEYTGRLGGEAGTKIRVAVGFRRGAPATVRRVRYRGLDADCELAKPDAISGRWIFDPPYRVGADRRFRIAGHDDAPIGERSSLEFTGRFTASLRRLRGEFQSTAFQEEEPQQTCVGATRAYRATRR